MENRNLIIALVLMLAVWGGFTFLFPPPTPPSNPTSSLDDKGEGQTAGVSSGQPPSLRVEETVGLPSGGTAPLVQPVAERHITIDTPYYQAVLTNAGGRVKSFQLKKYGNTPAADASRVVLVNAGSSDVSTLRTSGTGGVFLPAEGLFHVDEKSDLLELGLGQSRDLVFRYFGNNGLVVDKTYRFRGDSYDFDVVIRLRNEGAVPVRGTVSFSLVQPWDDSMAEDSYTFVGPATLVNDKVEMEKVKDLVTEPKVFGQGVVWSAFESKYFITAMVPLAPAVDQVRVEKIASRVENTMVTPEISLLPKGAAEFRFLLYFGPRDPDILQAVDHQLARAIDFGFFTPIAKPLLAVLKFFYRYVGNYGVAIIILTLIIKLIFWPLTQKSYSSMKAMQKLQPEMQRIREKHKNDRERLNREIMELYRDNRVNPLGGCLPMLIQIPVFFALYKVLMDTIELRHAPFALWITDLAAKDPYYITPLVMGATMFVQQKMTPTNMDPIQAKIFLLMPVVFTFLFLNFPSGLVIYWLVNNLLTILQQFFINRKA